MTKKDLIRLLIKLMGVYVLLNFLPILFGQVVFLQGAGNWKSILTMVAALIIAFVIMVGFAAWLIFCPDSIINFLKLDKGFDDDQINLSQLKAEKLISVAVLIVGGMFILHGFAPFIVEILHKIYASVSDNELFFPSFETSDNTKLYTSIIELFFGVFLITNYGSVTRFFAKKNKDNESV